MSFIRLLIVVLLTAAAAGPQVHAADVLQELLQQGVQVTQEHVQRLEPPQMADGLAADAQRQVVMRAAAADGWQRFVRNSPVAPFALQLKYIQDADGQRIGHLLELALVAYGDLETLRSDTLGEELLAQSGQTKDDFPARTHRLEPAELAAAGIDEPLREGEQYVFAAQPLLNRVYIQGVGHLQIDETRESVTVSWQLDERFADAGQWSNRWQPIETTELGEKRLGEAQTYAGSGGYTKITRLKEPEGALFIETRAVFHEPEAWFSGSNLLRSKLPQAIQEAVRSFRRKLAAASDKPSQP